MLQLLVRTIIALVVFYVAMIVVPIVLDMLGLPFGGGILTIFRLTCALIALWYIIWGPPVPRVP